MSCIAVLNQGIILNYTASDTDDFNTRTLQIIYRKPSGEGATIAIPDSKVTVGTDTVKLDLPADFLDEISVYKKILNQEKELGERIDWKFEIEDTDTKQVWTMYELQVVSHLSYT